MKHNTIHRIEEKVETYFCDRRAEEAVLKKTRKAQNVKEEMKLSPKKIFFSSFLFNQVHYK